MFRNSIVGIDRDREARDAIALAVALTPGGKLTLAHAGELHSSQMSMLARARDQAGIDAELACISAPSPGEGLHRLAEERGADLIVVGACARGKLERALLGDDAHGALAAARCAVAIAPRGYGAGGGQPPAVIGVAYNATPESRAALALARELGREFDALVRVRHVVTLPSYAYSAPVATALEATIDTVVIEAQERLTALEGVQAKAVFGVPSEELTVFSRELDLLVVGSRSHGPLRRLISGSTAQQLAAHAECALLVLPRCVTAARQERTVPAPAAAAAR